MKYCSCDDGNFWKGSVDRMWQVNPILPADEKSDIVSDYELDDVDLRASLDSYFEFNRILSFLQCSSTSSNNYISIVDQWRNLHSYSGILLIYIQIHFIRIIQSKEVARSIIHSQWHSTFTYLSFFHVVNPKYDVVHTTKFFFLF